MKSAARERRRTVALMSMALLASVWPAQAQTSSLWGSNGELWSADGRLPDFSWAGYHSSAVRTPVIPEVARLTAADKPTATTDIARRLQTLINTVPSPGAIVIPAGRWYINKRVYLNRSGIVLRGEDGAELYEPQSLSEIDGVDPTTTQKYSNGPGFIVAGGGRSTTQRATITANAAKGAASLIVSTTSGLTVGEMIMITQSDPADKSLAKQVINGWVKDVTFIDTDAGVVVGSSSSFCSISGVTTNGDFDSQRISELRHCDYACS